MDKKLLRHASKPADDREDDGHENSGEGTHQKNIQDCQESKQEFKSPHNSLARAIFTALRGEGALSVHEIRARIKQTGSCFTKAAIEEFLEDNDQVCIYTSK